MKKKNGHSWLFIAVYGLLPSVLSGALAAILAIVVALILAVLPVNVFLQALTNGWLMLIIRCAIIACSVMAALAVVGFVFLCRGSVSESEYLRSVGIAVGVGTGALFFDLNLSADAGNIPLWSAAFASLLWAVVLFRSRDYREPALTPPGASSSW